MKKIVSFTIDRNELLAIQSLASVDESRFILNGVNIEVSADALTVVATDGRKLGVLNSKSFGAVAFEPMDDGTARTSHSFIVNCDALKMLKPAKGMKSVELTVSDSEVWFYNGSHKVATNIIDGAYPKWKQLIPTAPMAPCELSFNADFLIQFYNCAKLLAPKEVPHVQVVGHGDKHSVYSVFLPSPNFYGLVMPVRKESYAIPEFLKA